MRKFIISLLLCSVSIIGFTQTNTFPSSGNTGIGTTTPAANLEVIGKVRVNSASYGDITIEMINTNTANFVQNGTGGIGAFMRVGPGNYVDFQSQQVRSTVRGFSGNTLQITGGTLAAGKVLTSDASGNATWQAPPAATTTPLVGTGIGTSFSLPSGVTGSAGAYGSDLSADSYFQYATTTTRTAGQLIAIINFSVPLPNNAIVVFSPTEVNAAKLTGMYLGSASTTSVGLYSAYNQTITAGTIYRYSFIITTR